jgi:hypothetical protein
MTVMEKLCISKQEYHSFSAKTFNDEFPKYKLIKFDVMIFSLSKDYILPSQVKIAVLLF